MRRALLAALGCLALACLALSACAGVYVGGDMGPRRLAPETEAR